MCSKTQSCNLCIPNCHTHTVCVPKTFWCFILLSFPLFIYSITVFLEYLYLYQWFFASPEKSPAWFGYRPKLFPKHKANFIDACSSNYSQPLHPVSQILSLILLLRTHSTLYRYRNSLVDSMHMSFCFKQCGFLSGNNEYIFSYRMFIHGCLQRNLFSLVVHGITTDF